MKAQRLDYIDAMRGVAAILVLIQHTSEYVYATNPAQTMIGDWVRLATWDAFNLGKFGVVMFFAVSGFVIPFSFKGERAIQGFIVSRAFRLYPAYWVSLLLAVAVKVIYDVKFSPAQVAANITMVQTLLGHKNMLTVYWTLLVEIIFYAICMAAFSIGVLRSARYNMSMIVLFSIAALIVAFINWEFGKSLPVAIPLGLSIMHLGTLTRLSTLESDPAGHQLLPYGLLVISLILGPTCWLGYVGHSEFGSPLPYITSYYAAIFVFIVGTHKPIRLGDSLIFLGSISYSLYLIHPVFGFPARWVGAHLPEPMNGYSIVFIMALSIPFAWLMFAGVERPSIRLGKKLTAALQQSAANT